MDILSHGLWGGITVGRKNRKNFLLAFLIGISPDFLSFGTYWIMTFLGINGLPGWLGSHLDHSTLPKYLFSLYNATHSLVVFFLVFLLVWCFMRRPLWILGAWGIHILIDIPTHAAEFFSTPFLWPFSDFKVDGVSWTDPKIFILNLLSLAIVYVFWFIFHSNKNRMKRFGLGVEILFILIFSAMFFSSRVLAHQPRLANFKNNNISNPEISKAYFGELKGEAETYFISSDKEFMLYVNILVPKVGGSFKDKSVSIEKKEGGKWGKIYYLDGLNYKWNDFFEKFARDEYYQGPEFEKQVSKGEYRLIVSSPQNIGKYCLAIGKKESFTISEIIKTTFTIPKIKRDFFDKSYFSGFFNLFGLLALIFISIVTTLIFIAVKKIRSLYNKKQSIK